MERKMQANYTVSLCLHATLGTVISMVRFSVFSGIHSHIPKVWVAERTLPTIKFFGQECQGVENRHQSTSRYSVNPQTSTLLTLTSPRIPHSNAVMTAVSMVWSFHSHVAYALYQSAKRISQSRSFTILGSAKDMWPFGPILGKVSYGFVA